MFVRDKKMFIILVVYVKVELSFDSNNNFLYYFLYSFNWTNVSVEFGS
jgi:hypothetical protein